MNNVELVSRLENLTAFAAGRPQDDQDQPSTVGRVLKGAATTAGLGAVAYGAGSYLRGRNMAGYGHPANLAGHLDALKRGHGANVADIARGAAAVKAGFGRATSAASNAAATAGAKLTAGRQTLANLIAPKPKYATPY